MSSATKIIARQQQHTDLILRQIKQDPNVYVSRTYIDVPPYLHLYTTLTQFIVATS